MHPKCWAHQLTGQSNICPLNLGHINLIRLSISQAAHLIRPLICWTVYFIGASDWWSLILGHLILSRILDGHINLSAWAIIWWGITIIGQMIGISQIIADIGQAQKYEEQESTTFLCTSVHRNVGISCDVSWLLSIWADYWFHIWSGQNMDIWGRLRKHHALVHLEQSSKMHRSVVISWRLYFDA